MVRLNPNFPSNDKFWEIDKEFPNDEIRGNIIAMQPSDLLDSALHRKPGDWIQILYNKIFRIQMSYNCAKYYYENGFSDGKENPVDMKDKEFTRKIMFDFFLETGLYFVQSAYDVLGHILNIRYDLNLGDKIYFYQVLNKLEKSDKDLYEKLNRSRNKSGQTRNNFTHNIPPTEMLGEIATWDHNTMHMKKAPYTPAKELWQEFKFSVDRLNETIRIVKENI